MNCEKNTTINGECNLSVLGDAIFTESSGFLKYIKVRPDPPPYPRDLSYKIVENPGYTKVLDLADFKQSKEADKLQDRIKDVKAYF